MALSISLASALTSFFNSFLAHSVASATARSIVASPPRSARLRCCRAAPRQLPDLPHVRARHAPFEVADQGPGPREATEEDAGREDEAKRRPDRRAVPA